MAIANFIDDGISLLKELPPALLQKLTGGGDLDPTPYPNQQLDAQLGLELLLLSVDTISVRGRADHVQDRLGGVT